MLKHLLAACLIALAVMSHAQEPAPAAAGEVLLPDQIAKHKQIYLNMGFPEDEATMMAVLTGGKVSPDSLMMLMMGMGEGGCTVLENALGIRPTWINGGMDTFGPGGSVIAAMMATIETKKLRTGSAEAAAASVAVLAESAALPSALPAPSSAAAWTGTRVDASRTTGAVGD